MALPERVYYPLSKVAKIVKSDIEDLLHYAATGMLQICFPIPTSAVFLRESDNEGDESEFEPITPIIEREEIKSIPKEGKAYRYRNSYISIWEFISGEGKSVKLDLNGLLAIPHADISYFYDGYLQSKYASDVVITESTDFPRDAINPFKTIGYEPRQLHFSDNYYIDLHRLVISQYELSLLQSGGKFYAKPDEFYTDDEKEIEYLKNIRMNNKNNKQNPKTNNLQVEFIKNLLFIKYGDEAIRNPRNFVERDKSLIIKDFELNELKCPSGKSLENWLKK